MSGRSYGGETSDERLARRRRQLLDAGLEVFGTTGYHAATVRQLCREAGLTDRYFYEQFDNTEALLLAVYAECMDRLASAAIDAVASAGAELETVAKTALSAFLGVTEDDPRLARVVWFEVLGVSPTVEKAYLARMASFGEFITDVTVRQVGRSPRKGVSSDVLSRAAVGGVSHAVMGWVSSDFQPSRRTMVATLTTFLVGVARASSV